ncbi:MAG: aspartate carbamoyltransferase [Weeksellaceae bacterium]
MNSQRIEANFKGKHILSLSQFDEKSLQTLFTTTDRLITELESGKPLTYLQGTVATLLFFEPSSRTFSSFAAAIKRMGGDTIDYQNPLQTSSAVKGETLEDTMRVFETYSDFIVMRHPEKGAAQQAANALTQIPILNAGDGIGEHPTQALLDLYTIYKKFGKLSGLKIALVGDLQNGRTVHSLIQGLAMYPDNTVYLLSPERLKLGAEIKNLVQDKLKLIEITSDEDMPTDAHVWYWTRVQKERFEDLAEYEAIKNSFILTPELLEKKGNKDLILMHPLPRVNEIDTRVDSDPRAYYLPHQVRNGMYVRMALVGLVTGKL